MTDKELKRLSRTELLELLVNQVEENEALKAQVSALTAKLEERAIQIEESGSLAEARRMRLRNAIWRTGSGRPTSFAPRRKRKPRSAVWRSFG